MRKRKCLSFLVSLIMILSSFVGLTTVVAEEDIETELGQVKLEVYEYDSVNGTFGSKLNLEGENPDTIKVGKPFIVAVQVYGLDKLLSAGGLDAITVGLNYDSDYLSQSMNALDDVGIQQSKNINVTAKQYQALDYVVNNSVLSDDSSAAYGTDPEQFNKELLWPWKTTETGDDAYNPQNIQIQNREGNSMRYVKVGIVSGGAYYDNGTLHALVAPDGSSKKMLCAFKFTAKAIPVDGTILSIDTTNDSAFKIDTRTTADADGEVVGQGYNVLTGRQQNVVTGETKRIMKDIEPITVKVTDPSDSPVIVDPTDPDADTKWAEAVIKNLDENDKYQVGSEIHVKGIKREDGTVVNLPAGLKVKLFDKDGTQLCFGDDSTSLVDELSVDTETNDFVIDLTKVRNKVDGSLISDQTLYLAVQEDPKGNSDKVEIAENSPAPVITEANAKKVVDFETGKLATGSEVVITEVKKPAYTDARALTVGSEVKMYTAEGLGTGVPEATVTAAEDTTDNVVKATFDLSGKDDVKYYFTVTEPNGENKVPSVKAESLKTVVQEASARPVLGKVTKSGAAISEFEITGLKKTKDSAVETIGSEDVFTVKQGETVLEKDTDYTVSGPDTDGKVTVTFTTAQAPTVTVSATQTVEGVKLLPSSAVEVEMKVGKPIFDSVDKKIDPVTGEIASGSTAIVTRTEDGPIPENVELVLKKQDGTIVEGACVKSDSEPWTWTITLPEGTDQTFSVIAQDTTPGSVLKPSDPAYIAKNSIKPAGITITNNFTAEQEADKTYEVVVAHLENNVAIGKDDKLYIYKEGDGGAKGDLIATVNATPVSAVMTLADDSGVTYEFRHAFKTADLDFGAAGTDLWLEVEQTVNDITYMKSIAVRMDPVPSEIFVKSVIDPKAADANLNENGIPAVIVDENVRDAEQLAAMKPYLFKSRVAIPEGTAISKADLEGYTLNDKVVVEFNVAVTIDGIKSKYHAVPVTWTEANFEEETRTAIDTETVKPEDATETTPATKIATIEGTGTSSEFKLYGMAYDMSTILTGTDATNFTSDDSHNAKPEVTMIVKQMPKLELAEGNWNTAIEGERPEGEESTVHTYVNCYFRDPGFTVRLGEVALDAKTVKRYAYDGETLLNPDGNSLAALPDTASGEDAEALDVFIITNDSYQIDDPNAPGGKRTIGAFKHGDYMMRYVYDFVDTASGEHNDIITVKNSATPNTISITAERKVVIRYMRGDITLDGQVDLTDLSPLTTHVMKNTISDAVYFDGYCQYVADTYIDGAVDITDLSPLTTHVMKNNYVQDYTDYLAVN